MLAAASRVEGPMLGGIMRSRLDVPMDMLRGLRERRGLRDRRRGEGLYMKILPLQKKNRDALQ
jgi:hypothetical protein